MNSFVKRVQKGLHQRRIHASSNRRWQRLTAKINRQPLEKDARPVVLFNASTRLQAVSQNAAYSLLIALSLRNQGVPVIQFACRAGLSRCVLGSNREDFDQLPPCQRCMRQSEAVFNNLNTVWFEYREDAQLKHAISTLPLDALLAFEYQGKPVGFWAVNSLRWVLRKHHLNDDALTRSFMQSFILSGWNVYQQFTALLQERDPQAVVLFNGMFYPEAAARFACLERNVRVITHEVGLRPFTAFFTPGEATAYPMHIPASFQLNADQNAALDAYLGKRFKGDFSMAGVRFWPEMNGLDEAFLEKASHFEKIVPVFTNVIFDTSQVHANTLFEHMFAWLEHVRATALQHPGILFVIRAHPDECRSGKESRESVAQWVAATRTADLPNVVFVDSGEFISSYELIQRSHLVLVYNSTIGLETTLLGKPVLAGGKARFTQLATSFYPASLDEYKILLEKLLTQEHIEVPPEFMPNARRFLYYQLYATSLDFSEFLREDGVWKGYVSPTNFGLEQLTPGHSATIKVLLDGILRDGDLCYPV